MKQHHQKEKKKKQLYDVKNGLGRNRRGGNKEQ